MPQGGVEFTGAVLTRSAWVCHGSDCPIMEHDPKDHRCVEVTRVDDLRGQTSKLLIRGDAQEGPVSRDIPVDFDRDAFWGGHFRARVVFQAPRTMLAVLLDLGKVEEEVQTVL